MMKLTKGLTWPFLLLSLAATFVFMAGLAATQNSCYALGGWPGLTGTSSPGAAVFGMSNGSGSCRSVLRFWWFVFAFVTVTLVGLAVTAGLRAALHFSRPFWSGMVTISIILMMMASEAFLGFTDLYEAAGPGGSWLNRMRTAAAGAIMAVAFLVFLLMGLGVDWEHRTTHTTGRAEHDKPTSAVATAAVPVQNVRVVEQV